MCNRWAQSRYSAPWSNECCGDVKLETVSVGLSPLAVIGAYLVGVFVVCVIVSRVMGLNDPRTHGSKNWGYQRCAQAARRRRW